VRPVTRRREFSRFIKLPFRLYAGAPNWVPPLISERKRHLDRGRNPFFEHAQAEYSSPGGAMSRSAGSAPTSTSA
jgi:hypothetical protein